MANIKSMKKDLRRNEKARVVNQAIRSSLKTYIKKVRTAAVGGDATVTAEALRVAYKAIDKAAQRGVIHKNQAARRKARVAAAATKKG